MGRKTRVLIIDDSAAVRQTLTEILGGDERIEVIGSASDPFVAARRMQEQVPDVITLDVEMPRMDGITFLRKLMAQHPVPVVMCSSLTEDGSETLMQALAAGAVDVILKPRVDTRQLLREAGVNICDIVVAAAGANLARHNIDVSVRHGSSRLVVGLRQSVGVRVPATSRAVRIQFGIVNRRLSRTTAVGGTTPHNIDVAISNYRRV